MKKNRAIRRLKWGHFFSRYLLYPLCYYLIRYRRKVVCDNLALVFPDKTEQERKRIEKQFYLYFSDMIAEIWLGRNFDQHTMQQFVALHNADPIIDHCKQYGGCFLMMGHFMNWEWTSALAIQLMERGTDCGIIYKQLTSDFFNKMMLRLRSKKGGFLIEMNQLLRVMITRKNDANALPTYYAMLADQRPRHNNRKQHRTTLLGQPVGVFSGTEQLAVKFHYPVYYAYLLSPERGHYEATFIPLYDPETDGELPLGEITERYTRWLEKNIQEQPERWLWTHRRFLYKK